MTRTKPDFATLNAYVDGNLDPQAAAKVASAAAAEPALARELAKLHALKAAVREAFDEPAVIAVFPPRPRRGRLLGRAMAAGLAAAIAGAGVWFAIDHLDRQPAPQGIAFQALGDHDRWLQHPDHAVAVPTVSEIQLPDLTLSGLTVARYDPGVRLNGTPATHIGYVGKNGCHLSLFVLTGAPVDLQALAADRSVLADGWTVGNASYLAISRHMDPVRFATLAHALKLATRNGVPLDERVRTALAAAHQPCLS
jgi:hypothetical protein